MLNVESACEVCGFHDGLHLRGCRRLERRVPALRTGRAELSRGDKLWISALAAVAGMALVTVLVSLFAGCHVGELAAPCDTASLEHVKSECRDAVRAACKRDDRGAVDETCPTLIECQRRIESWQACTDGGAP